MTTDIQRLAPDAVRRTQEMWRGLGLLHCEQGEPEETFEWQLRAVERVILDMRERLEKPLSLDEMAEIAHLSRYHFNRVFRRVTGISPRKFLATLRLEHAKRLLLTTTLSITEVCFETGYSSLGTFTSHFTTFVGVTPSQWRRLPAAMERSTEALTSLVGAMQIRGSHPNPVLSGIMEAPDDFRGLIFVGLFDTNIPESRPCSGDLLLSPGRYSIAVVPDGVYFVLAVAIEQPQDMMNFFIPDTMLRGRSEALTITGGRQSGNANVSLWAPRLIDPPILIALPALFLEYVGAIRNSN
jgi:AraC-like DNA-binding protein